MKQLVYHYKQQGVTLVVAILFLLILTIISVFAATSSSLEFKMAGNMQDSYASFQSAEAGATATLALAGTAADPFIPFRTIDPMIVKDTEMDPFISWADTANDHPLRGVSGTPAAMGVLITSTLRETSSCPIRPGDEISVGMVSCNYYNIESRHTEALKATTGVHLGAVETVLPIN